MSPLEDKQSHSLAFSVFRVLVGLLIAFHGYSKFPLLSPAAAKNLSGEPFSDGILPIFLLVGGLCIATGFAPRLFSGIFVSAITVRLLLLYASNPEKLSLALVNDVSVLFLVGLLFIAIHGPGPHSVDQIWKDL